MSGELVLLSLVNWLHLAATVTWIGAIVTNIVVLMPAAAKTLEPPAMGRLFGIFMKRFRTLVYACIIVLFITGVAMMVLNRHYSGMLDLESNWAKLLVLKHVLIVIMVVMVVYAFEVLGPKAARTATAGPSPQLAQLQKRQKMFGMAGLVTALLVLLVTSIITAMSSLP